MGFVGKDKMFFWESNFVCIFLVPYLRMPLNYPFKIFKIYITLNLNWVYGCHEYSIC